MSQTITAFPVPARPGSGLGRLLWRLLDIGLGLAALGILGVFALRAATSVETGVDAWWYHLPWAARLAGLLPAEDFVFSPTLEHYYEGFPKLGQWLQGWLWRLTGRVEATGFVALGSLVLFITFLRWRFRVPAHLALLGLIGIPLVHIHATTAYVDLPANLALATALLLLPPLLGFAPGEPARRWRGTDLALFVMACAIAAHTKPQIVPVAGLVYGLTMTAAVVTWPRADRGAPRRQISLAFAALVLALPLVLTVPIKNLAQYGNPFHPLPVKIGPIQFSGPVTKHDPHEARQALLRQYRLVAAGLSPPTGQGASAPADDALVGVDHIIRSRPANWVLSVLEIGMEPALGRGGWNTLSSQRPPLPGRHGGYFGWYVLLHLAVFGLLVARQPQARGGLLLLFMGLTLVTAWLPNAAILRYYLYWMIFLVSVNLILLAEPRLAAPPGRVPDGLPVRLLGLAGLGAFLVALYATHAMFFQPRFYFLEDLLETRRDPAVLAAVAAHPATCLAGERPPRYIIYSRLFNPGTSYRLKTGPEAGHRIDEIPAVCGPGWTPVIAVRSDAGLLPALPGGSRAGP